MAAIPARRDGKTCVLFPGLDAILGTSRIRRWLDVAEVVQALDEASTHLSALTGNKEDLCRFLKETARPHLAGFDHMMVALTALQVGIARELLYHEQFDILTGCSHGDMAKLVIADSIGSQATVEFVWLYAELRPRCPSGLTANVRPLFGNLTDEQLNWLTSQPIALSRWSDRHATVAGTHEAIAAITENAAAMDLKVRNMLPYPIHSPVIEPIVREGSDIIDRRTLDDPGCWQFRPPKYEIVSSVYARPISTPEELRQESIDGAISAIRWTETLEALARDHGVTRFISIGPNSTFTAWMKDNATYNAVEVLDAWDLCQQAVEA